MKSSIFVLFSFAFQLADLERNLQSVKSQLTKTEGSRKEIHDQVCNSFHLPDVLNDNIPLCLRMDNVYGVLFSFIDVFYLVE